MSGLSDRLAEILKKMESKTLVVGFMENATYPDGTSVAMVAAINEFGHKKDEKDEKDDDYVQPPRPFFRQMVAKESPTWAAKIGNSLIASNYDGDIALGMVGEDVKGALQESINNFTTPELRQSTIDKKGGVEKPLIDTAHMLNSVAYEIRDHD